MKTPEELWKQYSEMVYPDGVNETQEKETRQAYMAGMLSVIHELTIEANDFDDEDVQVQHLGTFHEQLKATMLTNLPTKGATR